MKSIRALIIDDSKDIHVIASALLQSLKVEALSANSAQEGIALVEKSQNEQQKIDLILLDIRMPEMDGYAAAEKIRQLGFKGKIVVFTANATMKGKRRGEAIGIDSYLSKTNLTKEVLEAILLEIQNA